MKARSVTCNPSPVPISCSPPTRHYILFACSLSFPALRGPGPALCLFHSLNFVCVFVDHNVWLLNDYFIHVCMCLCMYVRCTCIAGGHENVCSCGSSLPCFLSQGLSQAWNSPAKRGQPWSPRDHLSPPLQPWDYMCAPHDQLVSLGF